MLDFLGWFDAHNGIIQAVATIVLVIITARSIKEAQDTRKDTRLPIIKLKIRGPINFKLPKQCIMYSVENIGYGLALDVKLSSIFNTNETIDFGNVEPKSEKHATREISKEQIEEMERKTKFSDVLNVSYQDIFERKIMTYASIVDENENSSLDCPVLGVLKWRVSLPR
ncbi:MAG: hypothetical protein NTZ87_01165 [Candidatus Nomurabacteria bacterium]|nr:hypothetical protein [Candidatus Nomurabacteria bacterium]